MESMGLQQAPRSSPQGSFTLSPPQKGLALNLQFIK